MTESHTDESLALDELQPISRHDELASASIAVLALGPIGDAILTTPLYAGLKRELPGAFIMVIASDRNHPIPTHSPDVDHVQIVRAGAVGVLDVLRIISTKRFDLYIDPKDHVSTTSRMIADVIRSRNSLTSAANLPFFGSAEVVPPPSGPHFIDSANAPFELLFPDVPMVRRPVIEIGSNGTEDSMENVGPGDQPIVINISAGHARRRWPREKWIALIDRLNGSNDNREFVILAEPTHNADAEAIANGRNVRHRPTTTIIDAAAVVAASRLVITPDTSIVHVASAFNRPTIALFDGDDRNRERFAPLADVSRSIHVDGSTSIEPIDVDAVASAAEEILASE